MRSRSAKPVCRAIDIDRMAALLHHQAGGLDPQVLDRLGRRLAGLGMEGAAELARAQMRRIGKLVRPSAAMRDCAWHRPARSGCGRISAPAPAAPKTATGRRRGDDRPRAFCATARATSAPRSFSIMRQREIDARGHAGRGPDRTVDDEDAVFLHLHLRKPRLQIARVIPVRGGAPAVEQTCFGQNEAPVQVAATRRCRSRACRRNSIRPGVDGSITVPPPTIKRVEIRVAERLGHRRSCPSRRGPTPPVSDSRCTS